MIRFIVACAMVLGIFAFAPTKASVNVGRSYYRPYRYYRPYGYYGYRAYRRPYYRVRPHKRRWRRRWRRAYYW